jgi:hypothetical protein
LRAGLGGGRQRLHDGVARELGMPLPLQRELAAAQAQEVGIQRLGGQRVLAGQALQVGMLVGAADAVIQHGDVDDERRQADAGRRPGMHLVVQGQAQRVVGGQDVIFVHGPPG